MKADEFDQRFDDGEDVSADLDWTKAHRPNLEPRRINVDLPAWMMASLDQEAERLGVTRQSLFRIWIADRLKQETEGRSRRARS